MDQIKNIIITERLKIIQNNDTLNITDRKNLDQAIIRKEAVASIEDRSDEIIIVLVNGREFNLDRDVDVWEVLAEWIM